MMTQYRNIDAASVLDTMNDHGAGSEVVYTGNGYALVWSCAKIDSKQWNRLDSPYRAKGYWLAIVEDGVAGFSYNLHKTKLPRGYAVIMRPGVIVSQYNDISDFDIRVLNMGTDFPERFEMKDQFEIVRLSEEAMRVADGYFDMIRTLNEEHLDSKNVVENLALSLFQLVLSQRDDRQSEEKSETRSERILRTFVSLLNENGLEQHRIGFYADKMSMTPNYLNSLIKKISGCTVNEWINRLLLMEAKAILTHGDMTVEEISAYLHFTNSPYFCRFFKRYTGMTPSQYRNR